MTKKELIFWLSLFSMVAGTLASPYPTATPYLLALSGILLIVSVVT